MISSIRQTARLVPSDHDREAAANAVREAAAADPPDPRRRARAEAYAAAVETALAARGDIPPTYLIKPAALYEREAFETALAEKGVLGYPNNPQLAAAARRVIAELAPANGEAMLQIVDEWQDLSPDPAEQDPQLLAQIADLELLLSPHPVFGLRLGARRRYMSVMPIVAAQRFLVGWENVALPFARKNGLVPDELLARLPREHVAEIGWKAWSLMYLPEDQRKNSASPSPSRALPEPSSETSPPTAEAAG